MSVRNVYRKLRFDAIRQLRWHGRALPPELKTQLSPLEQQYFKSYDKLLTKYMSKGEDGVGMDLTLVSLPSPLLHDVLVCAGNVSRACDCRITLAGLHICTTL